jgi:hypothetical protein
MAAIPYRKWQNVPAQLPHGPVNTTAGLLLNGLAAFTEWNGAAANSPADLPIPLPTLEKAAVCEIPYQVEVNLPVIAVVII